MKAQSRKAFEEVCSIASEKVDQVFLAPLYSSVVAVLVFVFKLYSGTLNIAISLKSGFNPGQNDASLGAPYMIILAQNNASPWGGTFILTRP